MGYILSIDQGTTGTTACLINAETFQFVAKFNKEYPQIYPRPGWVEHNLDDIWETVGATISQVLKNTNISKNEIVAIGITNQRETTCAFNTKGIPLSNAIVWQDRRTSEFCLGLRDKNLSPMIKKKTGLPIDPYFSASKMNWLLKNNSEVSKAALSNELRFGTIDTFLLYKLTSGESFKTDASNASRTMLMDLDSCQFDQELCSLFEIPIKALPEICDSFYHFGKTKNLSFLPDGIPITGILGDQQSALFGQAGFSKGDMKCTYGTGAFLLLNTGLDKVYSDSGLLTTVEYRYKNKTHYALEGSTYIAGAAVQWLRDNLNIINKSSEVEALALEVKNYKELENILFFPFFTGIGSPYWNADAKASIVGLTRDTKKSHLAFATLEGVALSINDLISAMKKDTGLKINDLKVDGGAVENNLLMELQATISDTEIVRPQVIETTAYGAALAAGIGLGTIDFSDIAKLWKVDKKFQPNKNLSDHCRQKKSLWSDVMKRFYL